MGDKFAGSEFEQPEAGPKGGGQDARNKKAQCTNRYMSIFEIVFNAVSPSAVVLKR